MMETYGMEGVGISQAAFIAVISLVMLLALISTAVKVVLYCCMFGKAGYSWALGLLMLVPIANLVMPLVLAFGDWPVCRQLREFKARAGAAA